MRGLTVGIRQRRAENSRNKLQRAPLVEGERDRIQREMTRGVFGRSPTTEIRFESIARPGAPRSIFSDFGFAQAAGPTRHGACEIRTRKSNQGVFFMSSTTDKIKGAANEIAGKAKDAVGKATGDRELRAHGKAQEAKGKAQRATGQAKDAVKKVIDDA
jgi:uncharacterized protein YjbJ (UPF0337 family)